MSLFESLKHRSFALLWTGQALSRLGDNVYRVALAWWVLEKTGSATVMGTVFVLSYAPMLIFALIGGVTVDRFSRVWVMLVADLLRCLVLVAVAVLAFNQMLELWHVYVTSIILGSVEAFFQPAYTAVVPDVIPREAWVSANSLTSLSKQLAKIAGPALSGLLVNLGSTSTAFAVNAGSFLVSAAFLVPILRLASHPAPRHEESSVMRDLKEGIKTVLGTPWLWITIAVASLCNVTQGGPYIVGLPFLVKKDLHADAGALGLAYSMFAAGSLVATLLISRYPHLRRRGPIAYGSLVVGGLMTLAFGTATSVRSLFLFSLVLGAAVSVFTLIWVNTLQTLVPRELLGRVVSIDNLGSYAFVPLSYGVTGWAVDRFNAPWVFIVGGALTTMLAAVGLVHRQVRRLD
jgi:DHA3 family tetracycline resistance protein-like MFS transporter